MAIQVKRWQDPANVVLGLALLASPWALGYVGSETALWNAVATGAVLALLAVVALFRPIAGHPGGGIVLGAWLAASPWVLGFTASTTATWAAVGIGVAAVAIALWTWGADRQFRSWTPAH